VDGQNRLAGLMKLYQDILDKNIKLKTRNLFSSENDLNYESIKKRIENFEFICTILVDFDLWEQGRVFADVNFNQKAVNKSIYYDIFGSYPDPDKNEIYLAHMLAMHLNTSTKSPLKLFIKMLGKGDGFFSQAFFVEAVIKFLFAKKKIWSDIPLDYLNNGNKHEKLIKYFRAYFSSIKHVFNDYWPQENQTNSRSYKHILVKTTGMGALLRLMNLIFLKLEKSNNLEQIDEKELEKIMINLFLDIKKNGPRYFSSNGEFSGAGSHGLQTALFKELGQDLKLIQ
ncbi:MAG: DGQHR domain-containing protein, partial [Saprospiraceae bacterium]|nr:DGQHR domain-containing protein [Saprospiraceae bacterium]